MKITKPPARWIREIETSDLINPNKTYSITELATIFSKNRATVSETIDVWIRNIIGNVEENRKYVYNHSGGKSRICREIKGEFLIYLSKKCNEHIHQNNLKAS